MGSVLGNKQKDQVVKNEPPGYYQDAHRNILGLAQNLYGSSNLVSPFNPTQLQGQRLSMGGAGEIGQLGRAGSQEIQSALSGQQNPYFEQALSSAIRPVTQNLTENILPHLRDRESFAGQLGSSTRTKAEGLALGRSMDAISDIATRMGADAYGRDQMYRLGALRSIPMMSQSLLAPGGVAQDVGGQQQAQSERMAGEPWQRLANYQGALSGQTGSTQTSQLHRNPLAGLMGGALGGAALSGMVPALGPYALPLAIGGGILGGFG